MSATQLLATYDMLALLEQSSKQREGSVKTESESESTNA